MKDKETYLTCYSYSRENVQYLGGIVFDLPLITMAQNRRRRINALELMEKILDGVKFENEKELIINNRKRRRVAA